MPASAATAPPPGLDPGRLARATRRRGRRSALAVLVLLTAVYAAGIGLPASPGSDLRPSEAHVLLSSESWVSDGDPELTDEYAGRAWHGFYDGQLRPAALRVDGRLVEPDGIGFGLLLAPAYALGGALGAQLLLAAIAAAGFAIAAALGGRLVPEPWASGAALAVGLSPPAVLAATTIAPAMTCATLIAGAALLALRVRDHPAGTPAIGAAALLAPIVWLWPAAIPAAAVVAAALVRWLRRRRRAWTGLVAIEILLVSLVVYVTVSGRLFGGLTLYAAATAPHAPTGLASVADAIGRLERLAAVLIDPQVGALLYAPVLALGFTSAWLLRRSRRERLARAFPAASDVEACAGLLALVCVATALGAALLLATLDGRAPGEPLAVALPCAAALCAWSLRRFPRAGAALALVGVVLTVWTLTGARLAGDAGVSPVRGPLPWSVVDGR
ncbi:MAG: hypothetical protein LT070_05470 [Solirubrobacteraceae bacterium]|nr:hypothetical protein [Solirubrobacteraceae bacterium]